jgi:transposase
MTAGERQVSTYREVDTRQAGGQRRRWSLEVKRQLVAETLEPGSSVSVVARRHDVNANQLFKWRHELAGSTAAAAALIPVAVMPEPPPGPPVPPAAGPSSAPGRIEIVLPGGVRVRIEGAADPAAIAAAMAALSKARRRR